MNSRARILFVALVAFILSGIYLIPLAFEFLKLPSPGEDLLSLLAKFEPYRNALLMNLALYIALECVFGKVSPSVAVRVPEKPQPAPKPAPPPKKVEQPPAGDALVLLSLLQEKGRFVDFLMEDITAYNDVQVAGASRVVHQGCASVIKEYLDISPVHSGKEGERIVVDKSKDPNHYRLIGKVLGEPPFSGVVVHRGWKTAKLSLPRFTHPVDPGATTVITPAEVEVRQK